MPLLADYTGRLDRPATWKGLGAEDRAILQEAVRSILDPGSPAWFYVPVGRGPRDQALPTPPDEADRTSAPWFKRIDLVVTIESGTYAVEIKPAAGYTALGQALAYSELAARQWPELRLIRPAILTDAPDPDLAELRERQGVLVLALPGQAYVPRGRPT